MAIGQRKGVMGSVAGVAMAMLAMTLGGAGAAMAAEAAAQGNTPEAPAADTPESRQDAADQQAAAQGLAAVQAGQFGHALEIVEPANQQLAVEAMRSGQRLFCAHHLMEAVVYAASVPEEGAKVQVLGAGACDALMVRAMALNGLGRAGEAAEQLRRLTMLAPMYPHYAVEYGAALRAAGAPDKALAAYRAARDVAAHAVLRGAYKPDEAAALRGIGAILIEKGDFDGAQLALKESLAIEPGSSQGRTQLAYATQHRAGDGAQPVH